MTSVVADAKMTVVEPVDLYLDLYSLTDLRRPGALAEIGRALDSEEVFQLERMDTRDPIRNKITSAEEYLAALEISRKAYINFERRTAPRMMGALDFELAAPVDLEYPHRMYHGPFESRWSAERDGELVAAFARFFVRLAGAFDAYMGFITEYRMPRQQMAEFARARQRGEPAPPIPGPFTDGTSLRDVYWLNFLGPSYVERFGHRLDGLGVRQERTSNGGLVIWAAETPFLYQGDIESTMDYPWKQPFYDALGRDTFVHLGWSPGQHVPTREDHLRFVGKFGN